MAEFSPRSQKKIVDQVRYVSRQPRNQVDKERKYPQGSSAGVLVAVVKTTVSARSGSTPGHGTVTFKYKNNAGVYVNGQDDVTVDNPYATALPVGRWITIGYSGSWTVIGSDCPSA